MESFLEQIRLGVSDALDVAPQSVIVSEVDNKVTIRVKDVRALVNDDMKPLVEDVINEIVEGS